jgi:hypothetical protein
LKQRAADEVVVEMGRRVLAASTVPARTAATATNRSTHAARAGARGRMRVVMVVVILGRRGMKRAWRGVRGRGDGGQRTGSPGG